jgi:ABC-type nitrate/sulfonate/bicarbonate transport system permease component
LSSLVTKYEHLLLAIAGIGLFLAAWSCISSVGEVPAYILPSPYAVVLSLYELFASGTIYPHLVFSGQEFFLGYGLALICGVSLGILFGWYRRVNYLFEPIVSALYSTPRIAFIPLLLIVFGVMGILKTAATVFLMAFFPILMNTIVGVRMCEASYVMVGKALGAGDFQLVRDVVIPGSIPSIVTGLRIAVSLGLTALVVGDLYGAQAGLGFLLYLYANSFRIADMMAVIIVFAIAGIIGNVTLKKVEDWFSVWKPSTVG